jgi:hypothetical protein
MCRARLIILALCVNKGTVHYLNYLCLVEDEDGDWRLFEIESGRHEKNPRPIRVGNQK